MKCGGGLGGLEGGEYAPLEPGESAIVAKACTFEPLMLPKGRGMVTGWMMKGVDIKDDFQSTVMLS